MYITTIIKYKMEYILILFKNIKHAMYTVTYCTLLLPIVQNVSKSYPVKTLINTKSDINF